MLQSITPLKVLSDPEITNCHDAVKKAGSYSYAISWSHADQQYAAHCPGFPESVSLGYSRETALEQARQKVAKLLG